MAYGVVMLCAGLAFLAHAAAAGRNLQQAGTCDNFSNVYNCFVGGMQMGSVCVNQCISPRNPLYCQDCEDPRQLCAKVVPNFNMVTSTVHLGQGTNTQRCPTGPEQQLHTLGTVTARGNPFLKQMPNECSSQSYQYDCVIGTSHVGQVCVPLCPNSEGSPACIPCEDVRSNCAWAFPAFRSSSFITHFLANNNGACF
ncbi:hypothetical protein COCOBI_15-2760 [Coccomyxa sp. Obi]|nr:hypothetical protein COCOBI_15-2760 [Coccomyxa sp. Obi]